MQRLGTDYIDLYQLHTSDPLTPVEETLRTVDDLVRSGKIRYIGASNFMAWHFMKALAYSTYNGVEKFASLQANYSLDNRALEREFIPLLHDQKVGLMVYSPLSGGFLTGKYKRDGNNEKGRYNDFPFPPANSELAFNVIDVLSAMAEEKNISIPQLALAWLLHQPNEKVADVEFQNQPTVLNFYHITVKLSFQGQLKYGKTYYDFDEGAMSFTAPKQIISIDDVKDRNKDGYK